MASTESTSMSINDFDDDDDEDDDEDDIADGRYSIVFLLVK